jgi:hypothetical protein
VQEAEAALRELWADLQREADDREAAEAALKDLLVRNKELERQLEVVLERASEKEILKVNIISPSPEFLSPTFLETKPKKGWAHQGASTSCNEASDRKASHEAILGEGLKVEDWSSVDERRKNSLKPNSETDHSGWQQEINATQTLMKEELEKRDHQLHELQKKVENLIKHPMDKSMNSNGEEDGNVERKSVTKVLGGVLRHSTRFQQDSNQLLESRSYNKSPIDQSRVEKKSVRIVENGEDGASFIETGRGSVILHSPVNRRLQESKQDRFQITPKLITEEGHQRIVGTEGSVKAFQTNLHNKPNLKPRKSLKHLHLQVANVDNREGFTSRSKSAEKKEKLEDGSRSKRKGQLEDSMYQSFVEDAVAEQQSRREQSVKSRQTKASQSAATGKQSRKPGPGTEKKAAFVRMATVTEGAKRDKDDSFDSQASPDRTARKAMHPQTVGKDYVGLAVAGSVANPRATVGKPCELDSDDDMHQETREQGTKLERHYSAADLGRLGKVCATQSFNLKPNRLRSDRKAADSVKADLWQRVGSRAKDFNNKILCKPNLKDEGSEAHLSDR